MSEALPFSNYTYCLLQPYHDTTDGNTHISKLDAVQRKMMRKLVGWVRFADKDWEITGQRMKARLEAALARFPIPDWSMVRQMA